MIRANRTRYLFYQNNRNPFIDYPEFVDLIWAKANATKRRGSKIFFGIIVDLTVSAEQFYIIYT